MNVERNSTLKISQPATHSSCILNTQNNEFQTSRLHYFELKKTIWRTYRCDPCHWGHGVASTQGVYISTIRQQILKLITDRYRQTLGLLLAALMEHLNFR